MKEKFYEFIDYCDNHRDLVRNVLIFAGAVAIGVTISKQSYEAGYVRAICDILDKNEGKAIVF